MSNNLTEREKQLLRQQAEAYAFIDDIREVARLLGTNWLLARMKGLDTTIETRRQEYPRTFQRYFNQAKERARAATARNTDDGQRKGVSRRQAKEEKQDRRKPQKRKGKKDGAKRETPE